MNQLLMTLRFYATGTFQLVVGDTFSIHKSTVCRTVHRVTRAIAGLRDRYIKFPSNDQERRDIMNEFHKLSRMPGVLGAIDCTHIPIQSPGGDNAEIYRNRKGYFSINCQLVSDCSGYITDVVARWPGSVHDSTIFDNSHLRAKLETEQLDGFLVGDGGYACRRYMMTPIINPTTNAEKAYNNAQISARNCIERTNGMLKRRFPALKYGLRLHLENILPVIVAITVLHNIAITMGEDEPTADVELHDFIISRRSAKLRVDYDAVDVIPPAVHYPGENGVRRALVESRFSWDNFMKITNNCSV